MWIARSEDDGSSFSAPERALAAETGACGCCSLAALFGNGGKLYISFRAAGASVHRDMTLLSSLDGGKTFTHETIDEWELNACPVSTTALAVEPEGTVAVAWETRGQVYFASVDDLAHPTRVEDGEERVPGLRRKNPAIAISAGGETLLAWGRGRGWRSGGQLSWRRFARGHATGPAEKGETLSDHSFPALAGLRSGGFVLVY